MEESRKLNQMPRLVTRAAVYARYSSEMQASQSAQDQINRIKFLAENDQIQSRLFSQNKIIIHPDWIYKDEAITGKVAGRFGYQRILQGIREKAFDLLIVDDLSRLTRSLGNLLDLYQLLRHHDVELVSISDRVSSADPNAKTFFTVRGMISDFGNDIHAERTKRGLEARAREMFSTGVKPYGYGSKATRIEKRKGREVKSHFELFVIPEQAEVIQKIYQLYADGYGKIYISKNLNQLGIKPPRISTGWKPGIISKILSNEKYIGKWVYNKVTYSTDPETNKKVTKLKPQNEWIAHNKEELRIVSLELWGKVQKRLKVNLEVRDKAPINSSKKIFGNNRRLDDRHLLSGTLACGDCGSAVVLVTGKGGGYYGCFGAYRQGICPSKSLIRRDKIEKAFIDYLKKSLIEDPEVIQYATEKYNEIIKNYFHKAPNRKKDLEKELHKVSQEISNLIKFIVDGNVSDLPSIKQAIEEREKAKLRLSEELSRFSNIQNKRFLVTPYLVKSRLESMMGQIMNKGDRYNSVIKEMMQGPLILRKQKEETTLYGLLDIGGAIGSRRCTFTSPMGFEPMPPP